MQLRIRPIGVDRAPSDVKRLQALQRVVPRDTLEEGLQPPHGQEKRCRKLSRCQVLSLVLVMNRFAKERLALVLERLLHTGRGGFANEDLSSPNDAVIHSRRDPLGVAPWGDLFPRVCRPLATSKTRGASLLGLLKMGMESKTFTRFDAPALARYFGRPKTQRGQGAFPQARWVTLEEVGPHPSVDAGVWALQTGPREGAKRVLRSVKAGMRVFLDRGLSSLERVWAFSREARRY